MDGEWTKTLAAVAVHLNRRDGLEWMLVGSAATALRVGVITPLDVDIVVLHPDDVSRAATVLPTPRSVAPGKADEPPLWMSTVAEPTLHFGDARERWSFGVWFIEGVKVELAHIDAPAVAELMIETRSSAVWSARDTLMCHGVPVPTVPIETQLATMAAREQHLRLEAVLAAIESSRLNLDLPLLRRAFADRQSESPYMVVPKQLRALLRRETPGGDAATGTPSDESETSGTYPHDKE